MNSDQIIKEIEDYLVPRLKLDLGEGRLYYHLFRHSRLVGKHDVLVSVTQLSEVLNCSKNAVKPRLRSLQDKGIVAVTNTGWAGTRIKVLLPAEIPGALPEETAVEAKDIETIDFYKDPKYRPAILEREQGSLFLLSQNPYRRRLWTRSCRPTKGQWNKQLSEHSRRLSLLQLLKRRRHGRGILA